MGLLDNLSNGSDPGGGLLAFLNSLQGGPQALPSGLPSDQAQYGAPALPAPVFAQPAQPEPANQPAPFAASAPTAAPLQANAQMPAPAAASAGAAPSAPISGFFNRLADGLQSVSRGGSLTGAIRGQYDDKVTQQAQAGNLTARALIAKGINPQVAAAAVVPGNTEMLKQLVTQAFGPQQFASAGEGHVLNTKTGQVTQGYESADKTPPSVLEYQYYLKNVPQGQTPMDYATFSTSKARAGATNINNSVDMNSGQTYDNQLAGGLAKSHAALANGVEDAKSRARDIAAMQGALDAIQRNGGSTGGMGQQQVLDLKKTINSGATALGMSNPFSEGDISDKEFLQKFNRQIAGAQAKGAVGSRVTNFEMSNYLKANPGLDMSVTGNQRLLGIQAQIEQRNIAVGNAINDATAQAVSNGKKIDPVTVQKIITDYDGAHHIKDPVTGQDLTQSYALPEFQNTPTNKSMADQHDQSIRGMEKTVGGKTYYKGQDGQWYVR